MTSRADIASGRFKSPEPKSTPVVIHADEEQLTLSLPSCTSLCCLFWFVAACVFAGVFGWAYQMNMN